MAYPNQKSQYDFSLFEMKSNTANISTAPKKQPVQKKPEMKIVVNNKNKKKTFRKVAPSVEWKTAKASAVLLALLILFGASISQKVKLDEVNRKISRSEQTLTESKSENVRLTMQLNSLVSMEKVEDYAVNTLGMVKIESGQVEYIDLSDGDHVAVSGDKTLKKDEASEDGSVKFLRIWEYIG